LVRWPIEDGRMERWKDGRMEGWKDGRMEGWKDGGMEGGSAGRQEFIPGYCMHMQYPGTNFWHINS
jgi:hypothetical protein